MKKRGRRGAGSVFRKGTSPFWVIQYYVGGERRREHTGLINKTKAVERLAQRLADITRGEDPTPNKSPVTVEQLYRAMLAEISEKGAKETTKRWRHLGPAFGYLPARALNSQHVTDYRAHRTAEEAAPATINRELAGLKRMLNLELGRTPRRIEYMPLKIVIPKEANARQGFLEPELYAKFAALMEQPWLRGMFEVAYRFGWRKEELLGLRVRHADFRTNTLRLDPEMTKNGRGREVTMPPTMRRLLTGCAGAKRPEDFLFTRADGKPVRDFRDAWQQLTVKVGVGHWRCRTCKQPTQGQELRCRDCGGKREWSLLMHDLRRTAVRNAVDVGVPEKVAMEISGHETRSVFERYNIVDQRNIRRAVTLIEPETVSPSIAPEEFSAEPAESGRLQ